MNRTIEAGFILCLVLILATILATVSRVKELESHRCEIIESLRATETEDGT